MQQVKGNPASPDYGPRNGSLLIDLPYAEGGGLITSDPSANGYMATLTGAEPEDWADTPVGTGVDLDGAGEWTTVVTRGGLRLDGRRSYEMMIIPDQIGATYVSLWQHGDSPITAGVVVLSTSGNFEAYINSGTASIVASSQLTVGKLHHLILTLDGGTARLYNNGIQTASGSYSGSIASTVDLRIGDHQSFNPFDGRLILFRVYNRKLTPEEVWTRCIFPWEGYEPYDQGIDAVAAAVTNAAILVNGGLARSRMAGGGSLARGW